MRSMLLAGLFAVAAGHVNAVELSGKTLNFSAHSNTVFENGFEHDYQWQASAYFSSEGRIFFYLDNSTATGVVIEPGRSSGRLRAGGSTTSVDYSESGSGVAFYVSASTEDGAQVGLRFTISVSGNKCSVRGFRLDIDVGSPVASLDTSAGSCRITSGPP